MLEQKELNSIKIGEKIEHFFILSKLEVKTTVKNKPFLNLEFKDRSAQIPGKMWEKFEIILPSLKEGAVVFVDGSMGEFNGPQINVEKIRLADKNDNVSINDFLPKSTIPLKIMIDDFNEVVASVTNEYLKQLLVKVFNDERKNKFFSAPAGKSWHHAYIHGLLEHTLEIIKICELLCLFHTDLNRDVLITGALLHDLGKTDELFYDNVFDYTDKGRLIGHIVMGAIEVEKATESIDNFPNDLKEQIIHLILSHQGKLEFASPVEPKTLEAIVLYQADELSAKANAYKYAIEAEKNKGLRWTKFLHLANTSLYIPDDLNEKET
jgi:3'-5' exoribonuclease